MLFFRFYLPPGVGKCFVCTHRPVDNCCQNVGNANAGTPSSPPPPRSYVTRLSTVCPVLLAELSTSSWFGAVSPEGHYEQAHSWKHRERIVLHGNQSVSSSDRLSAPHDRGDSASPKQHTVMDRELRRYGLLTSAVERCYKPPASATLPTPVIK